MDANQSDDETVEFEIEVVTSSSSDSLISGDRQGNEFVSNLSSEQTFNVAAEKYVQETSRAEHQQICEPLSLADTIEIEIQDCVELKKPVDYEEAQIDAEKEKTAVDATSEKQLEEKSVEEEPIELQQKSFHIQSVDQETIPTEAREAPTSSNHNRQIDDRLEAPDDTSAIDESSEPFDLNVPTICNKVLSCDLSLAESKSLEEDSGQLDLAGGTLNVIGEQSDGKISVIQHETEPITETLDDLNSCEARGQLASLARAEAVQAAPSEEEKKYQAVGSIDQAPSNQQLVSEENQCPDGWLFVSDPAELQLLLLVEPHRFTAFDAEPLAPPDAAESINPCEPVGAAEAQTGAAQGTDLKPNLIDRQENLSIDQECSQDEPSREPEEELVQHQMVDISIELTSSACDAPKAPHVIILDDSGDGFSELDSTTHSPISMERQVCSHDDEYDSLGERDEDEEDLEREFDEEPEFEPRQVVVKRNKDPRDEYEMGNELGRGKFGTVVRCTEVASGRQLAAKFIAMRRREDREDVEREVAIMSVLQHKRLLQLYDAFDDGRLEMCLITELVEGGELFERIVDDDFELTEKKAAIFMRQICEGVEYMHSQQIVHLDMKPENILCLSRTGNRIKLIDFGLARRLDPNNPIRVMFGTPDFAAPEVLGYEMVTLNTDMWSVGVICYVLLSGLSPFMGENDMDTMANVTRATYDFNDQAFEPISDLAKDFISKLLLRNPTERLRPSECLKHPWLQKGGAQLEAAVRERRSSTISLMNQQLFGDIISDTTHPSASAVQRHRSSFGGESTTSSGLINLDKRRLKRYVVKRKWHRTVHAIMALNRMGANLNKLTK